MRSVDGTASKLSAKRIGYIAGNTEFTFCKLRNYIGICDLCDIFQSSCAWKNLFSIFVQKCIAKCLKHSHTTVIGGTSADTHDKSTAAFFDGIFDHLTDAVGCSIKRISFFVRNLCDSCCTGHLDHCGLCTFNNAVLTDHRLSKRTCNFYMLCFSIHSRNKSFYCSLSAICQRSYKNLSLCVYTMDAFCCCKPCLHGCHAAFKRIDCCYYLHCIFLL